MRGRSSGRAFAILLALLFAALLWFWLSESAGLAPPSTGDHASVDGRLRGAQPPTRTSVVNNRGRPVGPDEGSLRTIEENSVAGRMVFLNFRIGPAGVELISARGAAGRVKPSLPRAGVGLLEYEIFDVAGRRVASGSVEDPTHRSLEYPDSSDTGRIQQTTIVSPEGVFAIRVAGEHRPGRIVLYRAPVAGLPATARRAVLAEFPLRARP